MGSEKIAGVYAIMHPASGRAYIGSSKDVLGRWADHQKRLKAHTHHSPYLQNAWNKYGNDSFSFVLIERCQLSQLIVREQFWISQAQASNHCFGFNMSGLAHAPQPSSEGRARIGESNKRRIGKPWNAVDPDSWKKNISHSRTGKKYGQREPEVGRKISASLTGKKHSESRKKNISNSIMALSPEARSERAHKAWETRRAKMEVL